MNKTQKILLIGFGFQVALIAIVFLLQRPATAQNNLIFPDLKLESVSAIEISDSSGNTVSLRKQGQNWVLPMHADFPVNSENVQQLVEKLAIMRDNRLVTRSETSHDRLKISDQNFERKVEIEVNGKREVIFFGTSPVTSNIHFRLDGNSEVFLTNAVSSSQLNTAISGWVNTVLFQIPSESVKKIAISNQEGLFLFEPSEGSDWTSDRLDEGTQFDQSKWSSLLSGFTNVRFVEPVSKTELSEYGFSTPSAEMVIEFTQDNGEITTETLLIGSQDEIGNYYTKWTGSDYIFLISSFNAERFINLGVDDYSSPLPTEEAIDN